MGVKLLDSTEVLPKPPPPTPLPQGEWELSNQMNLMEFQASVHSIYSIKESQPDSPNHFYHQATYLAGIKKNILA